MSRVLRDFQRKPFFCWREVLEGHTYVSGTAAGAISLDVFSQKSRCSEMNITSNQNPEFTLDARLKLFRG
jgi:hypothetical protein